MKPLRVIVVGGGIAGLACAHRLKREVRTRGRALELLVLEADERAAATCGPCASAGS
jgi:flavin-dependent dehydrogenase